MIVTATPNPSIDRTRTLDGPLAVGGVNRVIAGTVQAGGKGVNVATVLHTAGEDVLSVVAAPTAGLFAELVAESQVPTRFLRDAAVRTNDTLVDADGVTTKINEAGGFFSPAEFNGVLDHVVSGGDWLVLAGSLPPAFPVDWFATTTSAAHRRGALVAVDTSGHPLTELILATGTNPLATPDLITPNAVELAELLGCPASTGAQWERAAGRGNPGQVADAVSKLVRHGFSTVLVSLGASGALLAAEGHSWFCAGPDVDAISTVGAGDSALAGYLIGLVRGLEPAERLALAVAHGSAAVSLPGTTLPIPEDLPTTLPVARQIH